MAGKTKRATLVLTDDQKAMLKELAGSRTAPLREVERAKVLVGYAEGGSITQLQREIGVSRPMIYKCIDKALSAGVRTGGARLRCRPGVVGRSRSTSRSSPRATPRDQSKGRIASSRRQNAKSDSVWWCGRGFTIEALRAEQAAPNIAQRAGFTRKYP